jgi:DNA invertase Pin-like site-specific DNA recombinase
MPVATTPPIQRSSTSPTGSPTGGCAEDATSPTPPDMTDRTLRAVAYVRESTEEQGQGFSPDAQREGIRRFAPENNLELVGEYCDFHSGWRKSEARPEFQRLMADAAAGKFDVVLVFHTSRFARNQVEARRYKQLLRGRLGIRVVSVTQPMGEDHTDPSAFLAESIHEMFDEYYSVSLSFWTRSGLKEKARQGHLVGSLPWGYVRDPDTKLAIPHPERAPLVLAMFERYTTGQESDRTLAAWLNAKGARSARGRLFSKGTVREMLCNTAYAGYVSGLRDKSRAIKGLHAPIVSDELFDRVQEVRSWRTRVVKPGRPSEEYLLRKLIHCERCGARMHGCRTGRERCAGVLEEELQRAKPPTDPDLDRAQTILEDFSRFWDSEPEPAERRRLILSLFAQVWAKDNQIVAVKPNPAFANYFTAASEVRATHPTADAEDEATNTGATGVEPAFGTTDRDSRERRRSRLFGRNPGTRASTAISRRPPCDLERDHDRRHPQRGERRLDRRVSPLLAERGGHMRRGALGVAENIALPQSQDSPSIAL